MSRLLAVVLTHNEERHLPDCLRSLAWADHALVFDSFSTDGTLAAARAAGARVEQRAFDDYAGQREAALRTARTAAAEWVLFVDADERVPPELAREVGGVLERPEAGWWIPRHNYIFGRLTRHAGWYPDYQLRLMRPERARYDPARPVHELVLLDGAAGHLRAPLVHLNYDHVREFVAKQNQYAAYDARQMLAEGTRARPHHLLTRPLRHFLWRYISLAGWRDGLHGLRLSLLMSYFEYQKLRQLSRLQAGAARPHAGA